jgi:hypothetical protein
MLFWPFLKIPPKMMGWWWDQNHFFHFLPYWLWTYLSTIPKGFIEKEYFKVDVWGLQSKAKKMQTFKNVARNAPILVLTTMAMPSPWLRF